MFLLASGKIRFTTQIFFHHNRSIQLLINRNKIVFSEKCIRRIFFMQPYPKFC